MQKLGQDLLAPGLRQGRNIMQRYDQTFHGSVEVFRRGL
jgi:hypothetical protein